MYDPMSAEVAKDIYRERLEEAEAYRLARLAQAGQPNTLYRSIAGQPGTLYHSIVRIAVAMTALGLVLWVW